MNKLLFIALISMGVQGQVILLKKDDNSQEAVSKAPVKEQTIVTRHIPSYLKGELKLTTGELKLFAGHAINLITNRCPQVDSQKLFQVQKYISKLISHAGPVKGDQRKDLFMLIDSIKTCSVKPVEMKPKPKPITVTFRRLYSLSPASPEGEDEITLDNNKKQDFALPQAAAPAKTEQKSKDVGSKLSTSTQDKKETAVDSVFSDDVGADQKYAITTEEPKHIMRLMPSGTIIVPITRMNSPGFLSWISSVFGSVHDFFGRVFGNRRNRRASEFDDDDGFISSMGIWSEPLIHEGSPGKKAFVQLIDELCRIYCETCKDHSQMINFKLAAKELLKFVFEDSTGMNLVATHYLDAPFLRSIQMCDSD